MALEKIKIKNFRNHKNLEIEFSPRITTIVGANRSGKSTILRALSWVATNRPLGNSFIKHGKSKSTVSLFIDGKKIVRSRGKNTNLYKVDDTKYEAFSNDVPSEVTKLLNISDVNFQTQHEAPFWLSKTAGDVSRQLNKIVNLDIIDKTLYNLAARIRKVNIEIDVVQNRLAGARQEKKELAFAKEMNKDLVVVEQFVADIQKTALKATTIENLIKLGSKYRQAKENAVFAVVEGRTALLKAKTYQDISSKVQLLHKLVETGYELQKVVESRPPSIKPLEKLKGKLEGIATKCFELKSLIELAKDNDNRIRQSKKEYRVAKQQFKTKMGRTCPLCGSQIKKKGK